MKDLKNKLAIVSIITLVFFICLLLANGDNKHLENKVVVKEATVKTLMEGTQVSGNSTLKYKLKYKLESDTGETINNRIAIVDVILNEEAKKYITFTKVEKENITSEIIEDGKILRIRHQNVTTNKDYELELTVKMNNAPNGYTFSPRIEVKDAYGQNKNIQVEKTKVETTSVEGKVLKNNKPQSGIRITLCKMENNLCVNKRETYSREDGTYTFSDIEEGNYKLETEEGYEIKNNEIDVIEGNNVVNIDINTKQNFKAKIRKYIKKVEVNENGTINKYNFDKKQKVNIPIKGKSNIKLSILYEFEITNTSNEAGFVKVIKENIPEGMELDKEYSENKDWKENNGVLYNKTLSKHEIKPNETKKVTIKLNTTNTSSAKKYLNKVSITGEIYHSVKYIVEDEEVKNLVVVDSDKVNDYNYTKDGYVFEGWYKDKEYKEKFNFNTPIEKDTIIYGKIKNVQKKEYKIIYKLDNDNVYSEETVDEGNKATKPKDDPIKVGYKFIGWKQGGSETLFDFDEVITENKILYAVFEKNKYTVRFINEGEEYNKQEIEYKGTITKPKDPEKKYYRFVGWYEKNSEERFKVEDEIVTRDITLYAKYEVIKYTVRFYDNDKVINEKTEYEAGSMIDIPSDPEKEGYTFIGWYKEGEDNAYNFVDGLVTEDVDLYSKYEKNKYVVTFYNENEEEITKEEVEHGERIKNVPNTNKKYYRFVGWYEKGETEKFDLTKEIKKNTNLYAKYEVIKYTVRFYDNDKVINEKTEYEAGSMIDIPSDPEKEGYTFKGWYKEGEDEEYNFVDNLVTENVDLYSRYEINKYKVEYYDVNPETKKEEKVGSEEVEYNKEVGKIEEIEGQIGKKTGYTLVGWIKENKEEFVRSEKIKENIKLYTKYVEVKNGVIFDDEGRIETKEVQEGKTVEKIESKGKEGYTFKYWSKDKINEFDFNTPILETITLYAVYEINSYTLTVNPNGGMYNGSVETKTYTLNYGEEKEIETPTKEGYTFTGWTLSKENVLENNIVTMPSSDVTLEANYEINSYTLTVNPNGGMYNGSVETKTYTLNYGEEKEIETPTKEGYTFTGWTSTVPEALNEGIVTMPSSNVTLEANYEINSYTLTVNPNGGMYNGSVETKTYTLNYGEEKEIENPTKEGYTFTGWTSTVPEVLNEGIVTMPSSDVTLEANYEINKYTVTFINEGEEYNKQEVEYKGKVTKPEEPEKEGYTFKYWSKDKALEYNLEEEVTEDVTLYSVYEINKYTVTFENEGQVYETRKVNYKEKVSAPEENPRKENNIFRGWNKENTLYDFESEVISDITLNAVYEEVEKPVISHEPISWTNDKVMVTVTNDNHPEYSFKYKIDNGEYKDYTGPFEVLENSVVTGISIKENVESKEEIHEIKNIDKIKPTIISLEENSEIKSAVSAKIKIKAKDEESGIKEIKIYVDGEEKGSIEKEEGTVSEQTEEYEITGLEELTSYRVKIKVIDYAGNEKESDEIEVTTIEKDYVAQIIKLGEEDKSESPIRKETLEEAIEYCNITECTIQMIKGTTENVEVLEGQKIKLDLNGQIVRSESGNTIINTGDLTIIDNGEAVGQIISEQGIGVQNRKILTVGENEEELVVSTSKPNIIGNITGIESPTVDLNGSHAGVEFKFLDGRIEGNVAITGTVTETPYLYNTKVESGAKQVATLTILAEAEARINTTYYTKVSNAMNEAKKGYYNETEESTTDLMSLIKNIPGYYEFFYNEKDGTLTNTNKNNDNTTANTYIKLDLTNESDIQSLTINAEISSEVNRDIGYATITESETVPTYDNSTGRIIYISGDVVAKDYNVLLSPGKVYYLHFGYIKDGSDSNGNDTFKINKIKMQHAKTNDLQIDIKKDLVTPNQYGFNYDETTGNLTNTNQNISNSVSNSYIKIDLSNYVENQLLILSAKISSEDGCDIGYATITESETVPAYNSSAGRFIYITGTTDFQNYKLELNAGKIYYLHFGYRKDHSANIGDDTFTVNIRKIGTLQTTSYNYVKQTPVLNEDPDTIELLKNITLSSPIEIEDTRDVVLDLRGQTLTTQTTDYVIKNSGSLKVIDSKYSYDSEKAENDYLQLQRQYDEEYESEILANNINYNSQIEEVNNLEKEYEEKLKEYNEKLNEYNNSHYEFDYTGDVQTFTIPETGKYKVELWGAQGGSVYNDTVKGGKGAYTKGIVSLEKNQKIYVYVGENYNNYKDSLSFNGGGKGSYSYNNELNGNGGGATDVRIVKGISWDDFDSLKSRIMVSGGGGGASIWESYSLKSIGGNGGNINGGSGNSSYKSGYSDMSVSTGGTQTEGGLPASDNMDATLSSYPALKGKFGTGGYNTTYSADWIYNSGGGGGYYGGGAGGSGHSIVGSAAGGSSFISGYDGCDAISEDSTEEKIIHTGQSVHYSGLKFTDSEMKAGNEEMPTHDGTSTMTGNTGNGYARITKLDSEGKEITKPTKPEKSNKIIEKTISNDNMISKAGTLICTLSGREYRKTTDTPAFGAYFSDGWSRPLLIGETQDSVLFSVGSTVQSSSNTITYNGKKYYYSSGEFAFSGDLTSTGGVGKKLKAKNINDAVVELLKDTFEISKEDNKTIYYSAFEKESTITNFKVYYSDDINKQPKTVQLLGSNDEKEYTVILDTTIINSSDDNYINIDIPKDNYNSFKNYKWIFTNDTNDILISKITPKIYDVSKNHAVKRIAVKEEAIQQGNITSTTGNIILNEENANLVVDQAIINVNKSGSDISYTNGITNYGTLKLNEQGVINNNSQYAVAVDNKMSGSVIGNNGYVNITGTTGAYGVRNYSIVQNDLSNLNFSMNNTSAYGILHYADHELNVSNIISKNSGNAIYMGSNNILNVKDVNVTTNNGVVSTKGTTNVDSSNMKVTGNAIQSNNSGIINVNSGTYESTNGEVIMGNDGTININDGSYVSDANDGIRIYNGTICINGGNIESKTATGVYINSSSKGKLNMTGGDLVSAEAGVLSVYSTAQFNATGGTILHKSDSAIRSSYYNITIDLSGDFKVSDESKGNGITLYDTTSTINIYGNAQILGTNENGILNANNVSIKDNAVIKGKYGLSNVGSAIIGEKDNEVNTLYPRIESSENAIINSTASYYDGTLIGKKENSIVNGKINDSEENYDLFIKDENDTLENISLAVPSLDTFGNVAQIDDTYYPSIKSAFESLNNSEQKNIIVLKNIRTILSQQLDAEKNTVLDINGKTIKVYKKDSYITNKGTLKIIDSTTKESNEGELTYSSGNIACLSGNVIDNSGTLNIEKTVISSPNIAIENIGSSKILKSKVTGTTSAVLNKETGQAEINKSTIVGAKYALDNSSSDFMKIIDSEVSNTGNWNYCVRNNSSGNIEIEESKISGTYESLAIGGFGSGIITIKSGSIYGDYGAIYNGTATSTINVLGGTFTGYSTTVNNYGILNISNGEIKGSRYETIHNYSGTLNISGGVIDSNTSGYNTIRQDSGTTIVTGGIIKHPTTGGSGINIVSGTLNIEGGTYSSNNTVVNNESGIVNMSNVSIENVPVAVTNNTGTVNINESVTINASDKGIDISGGTLNIGEKGNVSFDDPSITGTNYGVYNTNGKIYFYDGIIKGKQNQSIYGVVTETEPGYKIRKTTENEVESSILEIIGTEERAIVVNGINFIDLQAAINAVPDNTETTMELYSNIILNSDIVIPEGKIINLYYRGYKITKGNYTITNNGTVNVKDEDTSGGILGTIKALLNIEDNNISKNIIVYQMDDGSILSSVEDYTLESLVNGKYEKIDVEEVSDEVGRYNISSNKTNTLMTTINGRIYLNNITSGSYKLVSSSGKEISFEISDEGTLSSNIKENFSLDTNKILSLSTAEIITSIRTGQTVIRFGILISLISVILSLLIIAKRQNEKYL